MSMDVNESIEKIFLYKGRLIKNNRGYRQYIKKILNDHGVNGNDDTVKAFVMGAVDAMIFDIACSLDFTKRKSRKNDWAARRMRRKILNKLWKNK